jgi:hypothetical protein
LKKIKKRRGEVVSDGEGEREELSDGEVRV